MYRIARPPVSVGRPALLSFLLVISFSLVSMAQPNTSTSIFHIDNIRIEGNRQTKPQIIIRELPFRVGDSCSMPQLIGWLEESKRVLMNTTLFQQVTVLPDSFIGHRVRLFVKVKERFNIYPTFFLEPVDRNLNQWLIEQRASLKRVNYGAQLFLNNTTGRGDRTILTLLGGYTERIAFSYEHPYIDKRMKWGMRVGFSLGRNKEVNVETRNDKQVFLRDPEAFIRHQTMAFGELHHRPRINTRHTFGVEWMSERVADTVLRINANYNPRGLTRIHFPRFYYTMNYQRVDHVPYPRKGWLAQLNLSKSGIGSSINLWEMHAKAMWHWPINDRWGLAWGVYAGIKSPSEQPFINRRMLGYGNQFVSGYEYYVVDGLVGGLTRMFLSRELIKHTIRVSYKKGKEPANIPVRLVGRSFLQAGYVHDPDVPMGGRLANTPMYSGGVGLDLLLFYDLLFRFEYSVNRFGENGLFLHRKYPF